MKPHSLRCRERRLPNTEREYIDEQIAKFCKRTGFGGVRKEKEKEVNPVIKFNEVTGNRASYEDSTLTKIKRIQQVAALLLEEAQELKNAADNLNYVEVLDGALDVKYVLTNVLDTLSQYGFKVDEGWNEVCLNNELKYTTSWDLVNQWSKQCEVEHTIVTKEFEGELYYHLSRTSDGKVIKQVNHPKVNLKYYVPDEFLV